MNPVYLPVDDLGPSLCHSRMGNKFLHKVPIQFCLIDFPKNRSFCSRANYKHWTSDCTRTHKNKSLPLHVSRKFDRFLMLTASQKDQPPSVFQLQIPQRKYCRHISDLKSILLKIVFLLRDPKVNFNKILSIQDEAGNCVFDNTLTVLILIV